MNSKESQLYTSVETYLNGPDGMNNEVTMWSVSAGILLNEMVKKGIGTPYGGLHDHVGLEIRQSLPQYSILDLCSGPGNFPNYLSLVSRDLQVTGVDINPLFVNSANERFSRYGWKFMEANACTVNFGRTFDMVTASSAYHHIEDKHKITFLKNVYRHLAPSGKAILCENFLPRYLSQRERQTAVDSYYSALNAYFKQGNATSEAIKSIEEVYSLECSGEEEHKVDFSRFERHLRQSGLEIELDIPVWQPKEFKNENAGSHVLLLKHAENNQRHL